MTRPPILEDADDFAAGGDFDAAWGRAAAQGAGSPWLALGGGLAAAAVILVVARSVIPAAPVEPVPATEPVVSVPASSTGPATELEPPPAAAPRSPIAAAPPRIPVRSDPVADEVPILVKLGPRVQVEGVTASCGDVRRSAGRSRGEVALVVPSGGCSVEIADLERVWILEPEGAAVIRCAIDAEEALRCTGPGLVGVQDLPPPPGNTVSVTLPEGERASSFEVVCQDTGFRQRSSFLGGGPTARMHEVPDGRCSMILKGVGPGTAFRFEGSMDFRCSGSGANMVCR